MIEPGIYKDVMSSFLSGVTVVTTLDPDGGIVGITASAFSALSIDPALVLFCPNYASDTYPILRDSKQFAHSFAVRRPDRRSLCLRRQRQGQGQGHRVAPERTGQPAAGARPRRSSSANCGVNTMAVTTPSSSAR